MPYCNIRDFGARGDGVSDDTAAFERALRAAGQTGMLYLPAGTYRLESVKIPSHITILGNASWGYSAWGYENNKRKQGPVTDPAVNGSTVLIPASGRGRALWDMEGCCGTRVAGLSFDGLMMGESFHAIRAPGSGDTRQNLVFEDVRICHFTGSGIDCSHTRGFSVRRSLIIKNQGSAILADAARDGVILDTQLAYNDGAGLCGQGGIENLLITANRIEGGCPGGVWLKGASGVSITGNSFDSPRGPAVTLLDCCAAAVSGNMARLCGQGCTGEFDSHMLFKGCRGISVTGNSFWGWPALASNPWLARYGVLGDTLTDCVISKNSFFECCRQEMIRLAGDNQGVLEQQNTGSAVPWSPPGV